MVQSLNDSEISEVFFAEFMISVEGRSSSNHASLFIVIKIVVKDGINRDFLKKKERFRVRCFF